MKYKDFLMPDKKKIVSLIIFIFGVLINPSGIIRFIIFYLSAKTLTPSEFGQLSIELGTDIGFNLFIFLLNVIYWYVLVVN